MHFQDFTVNIYLRLMWNHPKMVYGAGRNQSSALHVDHSSISLFWLPDLYFPFEKRTSLTMVPVPNKGIRIRPSGDIHYSQKYIQTFNPTSC